MGTEGELDPYLQKLEAEISAQYSEVLDAEEIVEEEHLNVLHEQLERLKCELDTDLNEIEREGIMQEIELLTQLLQLEFIE